MENIEFITPGNHKVYLKPFLTYGERRQLERILVAKLQVDPVNQDAKMDAISLMDAQDVAVKMMVEKIILATGEQITGDGIVQTILNWPETDGKSVYDKIDELTESTTISSDAKKN